MYTTCDLVEYLVNLYSYNMDIAKFFGRKERELSTNSSIDGAVLIAWRKFKQLYGIR